MTTTTAHPKAHAGRRVEFTYYRDMDLADSPAYPGIITGTEPAMSGALLVRIRLDGKRSNLAIPAGYEGLRYLDEVTEVPKLPMGRFQPVADDANGFYEKAGVLLAPICEDGEELVIITGDRDKAHEAAAEYLREIGVVEDDLNAQDETKYLTPKWAYFEWQPEDAECPWFAHWCAEGDDQAIQIYYLPA